MTLQLLFVVGNQILETTNAKRASPRDLVTLEPLNEQLRMCERRHPRNKTRLAADLKNATQPKWTTAGIDDISDREIFHASPPQRLMLETTLRALEREHVVAVLVLANVEYFHDALVDD